MKPSLSQFLKEKLFWLGFLTLFSELALIRYLSGNIWNLSYFPNLVLLAVFIGMGSGFLIQRHLKPKVSQAFFDASPLILFFLILFVLGFDQSLPGFSSWIGNIGNELYFTNTPETVSNSFWRFGLWFGLTALFFICITQKTAKLFSKKEPLQAYSLDIGGSCAGIFTFFIFSLFQFQPIIWFFTIGVLFWICAKPFATQKLKIYTTLILLTIIFLTWLQDGKSEGEVHWSPYQKLEWIKRKNGIDLIQANGVAHQEVIPEELLSKSFYQIPYEYRKLSKNFSMYKNALIIGAGNGNDVATALINGVGDIDAVEIDPAIAAWGVERHPAHPYQDSRVHIIIDDGRAFLTRTSKKYDLIIFALTDSIVKVSSMSQLRLENFLFTQDSLERAYQLLNDGGDLVFYNYYRTPWLLDKLNRMAELATGQHPVHILKQDDFSIFSVRHSNSPQTIQSLKIEVPTDDWPFLYIEKKGVPKVFLYALILIGFLATVGMIAFHRWTSKSNSRSELLRSGAFFVMGFAFLLLETKSVIQFSLLFGTTWVNSSLVFFSILVSVLAANILAQKGRKKISPFWVAIVLICSCIVIYYFPLKILLYFPSPILRFIFASLLTFTPVFLANLFFSLRFDQEKYFDQMFGWNLLGALFGGLAEYLSTAFGYRTLTVAIGVSYILAMILFFLSEKKNLGVSFRKLFD